MRRSAAAATLAALALALAACSGSTSSDSSESASPVGGMTECTKEAVQPAVDETVKALGGDNVMTIEDLQCADGWAVASGILGPKDAPADGPQGTPTSFVFEAEGQFWVPKDKTKVCGTDAASSEVPESLYESGCASG
jgi:hypothetical protein